MISIYAYEHECSTGHTMGIESEDCGLSLEWEDGQLSIGLTIDLQDVTFAVPKDQAAETLLAIQMFIEKIGESHTS